MHSNTIFIVYEASMIPEDSINNFGNRLKINRNKQSQEKDVFVEFVNMLDECWARTNFLHDHLKIDFNDTNSLPINVLKIGAIYNYYKLLEEYFPRGFLEYFNCPSE